MKTRKSWQVKLNTDQQPKIVKIPTDGWKKMGGCTMLVSTPRDVNALIRRIPKGKLATSASLRQKLANDFGAECACPTSTGIFVHIAAEAAEEDRAAGAKQITPYWRVLKTGGSLNENFPGGVKAQAEKLRAEGFDITPAAGKKPPAVKDFAKHLAKF